MDEKQTTIEQVTRVKERHEQELLRLANVVGVGVGFRHKHGQLTDEVALVVNVSQKKSVLELSQKDIIPTELEGIPVDVQEVGHIRAL